MAATQQAPLLKLRDVTLSFDQLEVLRGIDLDVNAGVRHLLIGPNGAGKTTLFNVISGFLRVSKAVSNWAAMR
jgi:branched-chain amino acid transport system ATP-binding protein